MLPYVKWAVSGRRAKKIHVKKIERRLHVHGSRAKKSPKKRLHVHEKHKATCKKNM